MTGLALVAVVAAGLLEAGYMAWTRLLALVPDADWPAPPQRLRRAFPRLKFVGGLIGVVALGAVLLGLPPEHVGVDPSDPTSLGPVALALGVGLGGALYLLTELLIPVVNALGLAYEPGYDEILAGSPGGWPTFLGVVLPAISLREELLFRVALVGTAAPLVGLSPWVLAAVSTVVFGVVHFTGDGGVVIAAVLGGCLAAAFVLTNSLLVVVLAHTIVNGAEFVVHHALDADPGRLVGNPEARR